MEPSTERPLLCVTPHLLTARSTLEYSQTENLLTPQPGIKLAGGNQGYPIQGSHVQQTHQDDVSPDILQLGHSTLLVLIVGVSNVIFEFRADVFPWVEGHFLHLLAFLLQAARGRRRDGGGGRVGA